MVACSSLLSPVHFLQFHGTSLKGNMEVIRMCEDRQLTSYNQDQFFLSLPNNRDSKACETLGRVTFQLTANSSLSPGNKKKGEPCQCKRTF